MLCATGAPTGAPNSESYRLLVCRSLLEGGAVFADRWIDFPT